MRRSAAGTVYICLRYALYEIPFGPLDEWLFFACDFAQKKRPAPE